MSETIAEIKKTIAEAHEQGIYNWNTATISSLITTIESLQKEIEQIEEERDQALKDYESACTMSSENSRAALALSDEVESLKAITELAVNALKQNDEVLRELHSQIGQDSEINPSAKKVYLSKIQYVGETVGFHTLSEIERLQNE